MPKYYYDIIQGTQEWFDIKRGVVSASKVNCLMTANGAPAKNKTSRRYATEIAAERILGFSEESRQSYDMYRGTMQEPYARDLYNEAYNTTASCGFVTTEYKGIKLGVSPDGLVGEDGGIEIKSRIAAHQFDTIISGAVPDEHVNQIQTFLLVTGREWVDYVQYSNAMPLFAKRVNPDLDRREQILCALVEFEEMVQEIMCEYKEKSAPMMPTEYFDWAGMDILTASEEVD